MSELIRKVKNMKHLELPIGKFVTKEAVIEIIRVHEMSRSKKSLVGSLKKRIKDLEAELRKHQLEQCEGAKQ